MTFSRFSFYYLSIVVLFVFLILSVKQLRGEMIPGAANRYLAYWHRVEEVTGQTVFDIPEYNRLMDEIRLRRELQNRMHPGVLVLGVEIEEKKAAEKPKTSGGIPIYPYLYYPPNPFRR